MGAVVHIFKLAELRAKTDQDLRRILETELDRGLALANVAATRRSTFYEQAETIYARSKELLPMTPEVEDKLRELRMALDLVAGSVDLEEEPVCS
jgi:uncharacterized protein (DUF3084 family)